MSYSLITSHVAATDVAAYHLRERHYLRQDRKKGAAWTAILKRQTGTASAEYASALLRLGSKCSVCGNTMAQFDNHQVVTINEWGCAVGIRCLYTWLLRAPVQRASFTCPICQMKLFRWEHPFMLLLGFGAHWGKLTVWGKEDEGSVWEEDVVEGEEHDIRTLLEEIVWPDEMLRMLAEYAGGARKSAGCGRERSK
ncbi:hypothetical protein LTS18_003818 [Coniosporium uncinatum]|uniref:Uncharacterized protein n=1 Tax=Coniosporium uncinatum TaxID=93489 RepID=A0ACC3DZ86_9PEZI|nr:hypothetical protein LTS18_003818 [Coniosporium uncinatum]